MSELSRPVILLAFANDRENNTNYLKNLVREQKNLVKTLEQAEKNGLCELKVYSSLDVEELFNAFQQYKNRIAVFHYGGHANSYQLLLETASGNTQVAHRDGLVKALAMLPALQLVFLNACSTRQHAEELKAAGIPLVIATSQSISDETAVQLSTRFYSALAEKNTIEDCWSLAMAEVETRSGKSDYRALYFEESDKLQNLPPWDMYIGKNSALKWKLKKSRLPVFLMLMLMLVMLAVWPAYKWAFPDKAFDLKINLQAKTPQQKLAMLQNGRIVLEVEGKRLEAPVNKDGQAQFDDLDPSLKGKQARLSFSGRFFKSTDTQIELQEQAFPLIIERDESLARVEGQIRDQHNNFVSGVQVQVAGLSAETDKAGKFEINIPLDKQDTLQKVIFFKEGYQTREEIQRISKESIEILLEKKR